MIKEMAEFQPDAFEAPVGDPQWDDYLSNSWSNLSCSIGMLMNVKEAKMICAQSEIDPNFPSPNTLQRTPNTSAIFFFFFYEKTKL